MPTPTDPTDPTVWKYPAPAAQPERGRAPDPEPIAIVGIGCRLPGGIDTPDALWQALLDGADTGGFLDDVTGFDADLFRIPAAEARRLDPARTIALETSWAALEDARIVHDAVAHGRTGVFMGTTAPTVPVAIAHALEVPEGHPLAVATACGSSLAAVHLAVRALRDGAADLALAGGVSAPPGPRTTRSVRDEGCGILVLRRLSDALAAGDRVHALIRDSAPADDPARILPLAPAEIQVGDGGEGGSDGVVGVVALTKAALALHHGELPAGLHTGADRTPWPGDARRHAVVSGTGTHVTLEEPPHRPRLFVPLAADSASGLRAAADELTRRVRAGGSWYAPELLGRATGTHRTVATVDRTGELADALRTHVDRHARSGAARPDALAYCFSGRGGEWLGMGRDLLGEPAFRAALDACDRALLPFTGWSVTAELLAGPDTSRLARADVVQPVLFALQTSVARTLSAWGVEPTVVLGQGTGEVAAAVVAGALPLAEGARLITAWSRRSAQRACLAPELRRSLGALRNGPGTIPFWSTSTGGYVDGADLDAGYWARGMRSHARLADATRALADGRRLRVVEITPHPVARLALRRGLDRAGGDQPRILSTGHRDRPARQALEDVAAALWCDGTDVDWGAVTGRRRRRAAAGPVAVTVSGRTARARADNAARLADRLDGTPDAGLPDVAYTAARHRPHLEHRAGVVASSAAEAALALRALAHDRGHPDLVTGTAVTGPGLALLFPGQDGRQSGVGRELYAHFPAYRQALDEVCAALDPHLRLPLVAVLFAAQDGPDAALIHEPEFARPALFAVEVALYRLWQSWGVTPSAVAGHGAGEVAAAHVAGALGLTDAARLVAASRGLRSPHRGAVPDEFARAVAACAFREPSIAWVSAVTGGPASAGEVADPAYWVRDTGRFADAVRTLERSGVGRFVECGPAATPATTGASCVREPAVLVASQDAARDPDEPLGEVRALVRALGALHVAGQAIAWERVFATGAPVDLPIYAFQREPAPAARHRVSARPERDHSSSDVQVSVQLRS
ncbi:acyltransferase domain-containing protein [Streptomyces longispororuber]|uniref:acyltransferase domain-containing protein n=1 Tax=Streptomyces longispororuber TaxID=68230 RepID=UPI00210D30F8|nr:acyltransferase domain-containing protein [Streptomyces longispororuber]MCQ4208855.1 acyltransferase domain-containing protein [Streptomyces longispororuber]